jgi:hypothetical protein
MEEAPDVEELQQQQQSQSQQQGSRGQQHQSLNQQQQGLSQQQQGQSQQQQGLSQQQQALSQQQQGLSQQQQSLIKQQQSLSQQQQNLGHQQQSLSLLQRMGARTPVSSREDITFCTFSLATSPISSNSSPLPLFLSLPSFPFSVLILPHSYIFYVIPPPSSFLPFAPQSPPHSF